MTLTTEHAKFFQDRGILQAALMAGVKSSLGFDGKTSVIEYPYSNGSKIYDLTDKNRWKQKKAAGARLPLWRIDNIDFDDTWILTEGENDTLAALQVEWLNATSLPDGAVQPGERNPHQSGKLDAIRQAWNKIGRTKSRIILALDNDEAGIATRNVLIDIFGRWRCMDVVYPEHREAKGYDGRCKDLNEILILCGPEVLRSVLDEARPLKLEGVFKPNEIVRGAPREYYNLGIGGLEDHLRPFRGELLVMTGITGHGKTTFLLNVLGQLVEGKNEADQKHGLQIGLGTFEADYWEDIQPWYKTWLQGEQDVDQWMQKHFCIISHEVEPLKRHADIDWFLEQATDAKGRYGIDVLVLDPWNKVQHRRDRGEGESDYIGRTLAQLRNWAKVTNTIAIVTAHPTKEVFQKDGEVRMPTEGDIHGSMNWSNAADHVVIVYRPNKNETSTQIAVVKSRFRDAGKEGACWFTFTTQTNKYTKMVEHKATEMDQKQGKKFKW